MCFAYFDYYRTEYAENIPKICNYGILVLHWQNHIFGILAMAFAYFQHILHILNTSIPHIPKIFRKYSEKLQVWNTSIQVTESIFGILVIKICKICRKYAENMQKSYPAFRKYSENIPKIFRKLEYAEYSRWNTSITESIFCIFRQNMHGASP